MSGYGGVTTREQPGDCMVCFSLENAMANYKTKFGFLNRFVIPNKHQILLGDFNENFRAKLTAQLGVDTIAILYFAQARKMCQLQKWNIFF